MMLLPPRPLTTSSARVRLLTDVGQHPTGREPSARLCLFPLLTRGPEDLGFTGGQQPVPTSRRQGR